jgi:D-cysteine desulfhydrase
MSGGGNKVRKIERILRSISPSNYDTLITHGGVQSNHCRVVALKAAEVGKKCILYLHGEDEALRRPSGNLLIMALAGAEIHVVPHKTLWDAFNCGVEECRKAGMRPFVVPGGGHCVAGAEAYVEAMNELGNELKQSDWIPDVIIHASGTGATQAGLAAGLDVLSWPTRLIGISVGRPSPRGKAAVEEMYHEVRDTLRMPGQPREIEFRDEWLCGGYEQASDDVLACIRHVAETEGMILDPTYTGKAFLGLIDLVNKGEIPRGKRVLFWHTGGLMNLLSCRYFGT